MAPLAACQAARYRASEVEAGSVDSVRWSPVISRLVVSLCLQIDFRVENRWNVCTESWACLQKSNLLSRRVRCNSGCLNKTGAVLRSGINRFNFNRALLTSSCSKILFTVRRRKTRL